MTCCSHPGKKIQFMIVGASAAIINTLQDDIKGKAGFIIKSRS